MPANGSVGTVTRLARYVSQVREVLERERFDVLHFHEPFVPFLSLVILRESQSVNIATFHAYGGWSPAYEFGSRGDGRLRRAAPRPDRGVGRRPALHRPLLPGRLQGHPQRRRRRPLPAGRADRALAGRDARTSCSSAGSSPARASSTSSRRTGSCARPAATAGCCSSAAGRRSARRGATSRPGACTASSSWAASRDDEKAQLFRTADVYVSPATGRESFGIVLLEAMAAGAPIVASDIHGYKGVVRRGREALLVPPREPKALAALDRAAAQRPEHGGDDVGRRRARAPRSSAGRG